MALGREAIRRALWAKDGRRVATPLSDYILREFDGDPEKIIKFADKAKPAEYGRFAPMVFDFARKEQDALALELVSQVVGDATRMIATLLEQGAPSVYLHGGMAEPISAWLPQSVRSNLANHINQEDVPLQGAILMARLRRSEFPPPARRRRASR